jgi:hypothetical protein
MLADKDKLGYCTMKDTVTVKCLRKLLSDLFEKREHVRRDGYAAKFYAAYRQG